MDEKTRWFVIHDVHEYIDFFGGDNFLNDLREFSKGAYEELAKHKWDIEPKEVPSLLKPSVNKS